MTYSTARSLGLALVLGWVAAAGLSAGAVQLGASVPVVPLQSTPAVGTTEVYSVRPESRARFIVHSRSFFFPETVHGRGGLVSGEIRLVEGLTPTVSGSLSITAASLKSGIGMRDSKMRSVLNVKDYPDIVVTITSVEPFHLVDLDGVGVTVTAHGTLEVAGISVPLAFPVFAQRQGGKRLLLDGMTPTGFKDLKLDKPGVGFLVKLRDKIEAGADIAADRIP